MRKLLRQACDILAKNQYEPRDGECIECGGTVDHDHGCRIEAVFRKAQDHGLNYCKEETNDQIPGS